mmetsp:Transcript_10276/g.14138  ORF Transcript_10276/g.14138 Transcript_10276/m.14138 type:complete len:80 (-) Transcript_10276:291-530(-)
MFSIKNKAAFCEQILPKYFKHNNMTSFIRQLNMYDFHKAKKNTRLYQHTFRHPYFQKDKKHLLKDIRRKTNNAYNPTNN